MCELSVGEVSGDVRARVGGARFGFDVRFRVRGCVDVVVNDRNGV